MTFMLLLCFYGDDFTGSTDVMEALQWAGLRTVLFLSPPTPQQLAKFEDLRAFGVAGWSRTMSPQEMDIDLAPVFEVLRNAGAPIVHYKVCSTFDSSPQIGSIGKALEIGRRFFGPRPAPVMVGAPVLGRYVAFGNLFACSGLDTEPFRLDRHPTMRQHPITPMEEADLRLHLARQTSLPVELIDVLKLESGGGSIRTAAAAVLFDVLHEGHLPIIGRMVDELAAGDVPLFCIGSSGIEYALIAHWQAAGTLAGVQSHAPGRPTFEPVDQLLVVTGSCSPVNDRQIGWALSNGFVDLPLEPARLIDPLTSESEIQTSIRGALELADRGAGVILHTSRGPDDPRIARTLSQFAALGFSPQDIKLRSGRTLGPKLGRILAGVLQARPLKRLCVTGGDTCGYVARELDIESLEAIAPCAPGSPLCRVHSQNTLNRLEVIFKGGQVGRTDIYGTILHGTAGRAEPSQCMQKRN